MLKPTNEQNSLPVCLYIKVPETTLSYYKHSSYVESLLMQKHAGQGGMEVGYSGFIEQGLS